MRLLMLAPADSNGPIVDLLRSLLAQRLIERPHIVHNGIVYLLGVRPVDDIPTPFHDYLVDADTRHCRFFNVIAADAGVPASSAADSERLEGDGLLSPALQVDKAIRDSMENQDGYEAVNLILPTAEPGSVSTGLWSSGPDAGNNANGWVNIIVMPEVQRTASSPVVATTSDREYLAHATAALVTLAGLWVGAPWEPRFGEVLDVGDWSVARTRSRSLIAPELPLRVIGRVASTPTLLPIDDQVQFEPHPDPVRVAGQANDWLIKHHRLDASTVPLRPVQSQERLTLLGYLKMLWVWITGKLPALVAQELRDRAAEGRDRADKVLNNIAGLNGETDVIISHGGGADAAGEPMELDGADKRSGGWGFVAPEPKVWRSVRQVSFGLADGGGLPSDEVDRLLGEAKDHRFVVADRTAIVPRLGAVGWVPPDELRGLGPEHHDQSFDADWWLWWDDFFRRAKELRSKAPEALEPEEAELMKRVRSIEPTMLDAYRVTFQAGTKASSESLHGQLQIHLATKRRDAEQSVAEFQAELEQAEADAAQPTKIREEHRQDRKRILRRLAIGIGVVLLLCAGAIWGIFALALAGAVLVLAVVGVSLLGVLGIMRQLARSAYSWFLAERNLLWRLEGRVVFLTTALKSASWDERRFRALLVAAGDWADVVSVICHEPFGPPRLVRRPRIRQADLFLPASHEVREANTTDARLDGIASAVSASLLRRGWMGGIYDDLLTVAEDVHRLRSRGGAFEPDRDVTTSGIPGARRHLVDEVRNDEGTARRRSELQIVRRVDHALRIGDGFLGHEVRVVDRLFSRMLDPSGETQLASEFLDQATSGDPTPFNFSLAPAVAVPTRLETSSEGAVPALELPTVEDMLAGATAEFAPFSFTSWSIDWCTAVPDTDLVVFAPAPTPAVIDLTGTDVWVLPDDVDAGEIEPVSVEQRPQWSIDPATLPELGFRIDPTAAAAPTGSGPFAFMVEANGEPVQLPAGTEVRFRIRTDCALPAGVDLVLGCIQHLADRSGRTFVFGGAFVGLPARAALNSGTVDIAWAFDEEYRLYEAEFSDYEPGSTIGLGGPIISRVGANVSLSGGTALLNADMRCPAEMSLAEYHRHVLLHELGHALNLGHVASATEVMCGGGATGRQQYGPGDTRGLVEVSTIARRTAA